MATVSTITGDLTVNGTISASQFSGAFNRENMNTEALQNIGIPITSLRVWNAFGTALGAAAADDLGIASGTFGTGLPYVTTSDSQSTTVTQYARFLVQMPQNYVSGQAVAIRLAAGMNTNAADNSATVDVEAYKSNRDTGITGSDLISTPATSINSLTFANKDFTVSSASLIPGDWLDVRVTISINDGSTASPVIGAIAHLELICTTRG